MKKSIRTEKRGRRPKENPVQVLQAYAGQAHEYLKCGRNVPGLQTGFTLPKPPLRKYEKSELWTAFARFDRLGAQLVEQVQRMSASLRNDPLPFAGLAERLGPIVTHLQWELSDMARAGNTEAVRRLAFTGIAAGEKLKELARTRLEVVLPTSEAMTYWPVNYCPHPERRAEVERLVKKLHLGSKAPENIYGRYRDAPSPKQPFRGILGDYARRIFLLVSSVQQGRRGWSIWWKLEAESAVQFIPMWIIKAINLPNYDEHSKAKVKQWFEVGWAALREAGSGDPRTLPQLGDVGRPREGVYQRRHETGGSKKAQRRQGAEQLKEQLFKAFESRFYKR